MKYSYILVWPHGIKYKDDILGMISDKYKVVYDKSFKIDQLEKFVLSLYTKESKANIKNKNKFLLKNNKNGEIYLYIFDNHLNDIKLYNDIHKSESEWDLKIQIRNAFNPKLPNVKKRILPLDKGVSHDHVIHSSDTSEDTEHICKLLEIDLGELKD